MAAAYRSSTSTNTGSSTAGSLAVTVPAGVQPNDLLLTAMTCDGGTGATITAPSGWTLVLSTTQSTNQKLNLYGRIATGYETASYSWTFDTSRMASGSMVAYSGANPFMPFGSASVTTSASTTVGGAGGTSTYTGLQIKFLGTNNTTATSSITTPVTSFTKVEDTCTTASSFIGLSVQHIAKGFTLGGMNNGTSTCSQTANSVEISIMVEDARPTFNSLIDESDCAGSFTSARSSTSVSMQTNYPNTVLLAFINISKDAQTVSSVTATSLTWQLVARANTQAGSSEIWSAFSPTPFTNRTITANFSGSVVSGNLLVTSIVGADITGSNGSGAIGATNTGSTTSAAPSLNITTTRANSWVWATANTGTASPGTVTAGSNQTLIRLLGDGTNACGGWVWRQNSITGTSGTTVTSNTTTPTTDNCNIAVVEILPAVRKNLGALGAGS